MPEKESTKTHNCLRTFSGLCNPKRIFKLLLFVLVISGLGVALVFGINYKQEMTPKYITVTGSSREKLENKIATYSATITFSNADKRETVAEVRKRNDAFVARLKEIGIPREDIKTSLDNTYQEIIYKDGQREDVGDWISSLTTQFSLRDLSMEGKVSEILSDPNIESSWGPDFALDISSTDENSMLSAAIDVAHAKASAMAEKVGMQIVKPVNIVEGYSNSAPAYAFEKSTGLGSGGIEPGTTETEKVVTVTYLVR